MYSKAEQNRVVFSGGMMSKAAIRKNFGILLIISLFFAVFLAGYHHCCECYSQTCVTCQEASHQPFLFLTAATLADAIQPFLVSSEFVQAEENFTNPCLSYTPLSGRAPPRSA